MSDSWILIQWEFSILMHHFTALSLPFLPGCLFPCTENLIPLMHSSGSTAIWTQVLVLARQEFYDLSHSTSSHLCIYSFKLLIPLSALTIMPSVTWFFSNPYIASVVWRAWYTVPHSWNIGSRFIQVGLRRFHFSFKYRDLIFWIKVRRGHRTDWALWTPSSSH
jgi:hypothetical protein